MLKRKAQDIINLGKVAVIMGGDSAERKISLLSGNAIVKALRNKAVDVEALDAKYDLVNDLLAGNYQHVFIAMHGRGGEDGTLQGLLEIMKIPYTGSGVMGSAIAMDKLKTKQIWLSMGLSTPDYYILDSLSSCYQAIEKLSLPLIVKPVLEGSSIGMSKVEKKQEIEAAWKKAKQCGGIIIAEKWIEGSEYTIGIVGEQTLPIIELKTTHKFYDYDAKYKSTNTSYLFPDDLTDKKLTDLATLSKKAFSAVGASSWGRVDIMLDKNKKAWLIEVNTVPGMTGHSLVPMAAKKMGITFEDLVMKILEDATCKAY